MDRKFLIKLGITLLLLVYLAYKIELAEIKTTISGIRLVPFVISYLVLLLCSIPLAIRLRILLKPTTLQFSLSRLIQVQFISQFYALLLPSGIGIAIARWYKITQNQVGRRVFIVITLIERAMLALTLLMCIGIPLLFVKEETLQAFRFSALPVILLLLLVCFVFFSCFLHDGIYQRMSIAIRWVQSKFNSDRIRKILGIYEDFGLYKDKRPLLIKAFIFNLFYQILLFINLYLMFIALHVNLSPITILWTSMLVLFILSLPISIGGLGIRETGFVWFLSLYGIDPERGVLIGGMLSIQMLMNVGLGAILNMLEKRHPLQNSVRDAEDESI